MKKICCRLTSRQRGSLILKIFESEAFVNIIIKLLEIDVQELFFSKELAKQFPESFLIFISNQMHYPRAIVNCIQLRGKMFFLTSIVCNMLQKQLLSMQTDFEL